MIAVGALRDDGNPALNPAEDLLSILTEVRKVVYYYRARVLNDRNERTREHGLHRRSPLLMNLINPIGPQNTTPIIPRIDTQNHNCNRPSRAIGGTKSPTSASHSRDLSATSLNRANSSTASNQKYSSVAPISVS